MKKKYTNELTGRTVLVHSELTTDPKSRQGETDIVFEGNDYKNRF